MFMMFADTEEFNQPLDKWNINGTFIPRKCLSMQ